MSKGQFLKVVLATSAIFIHSLETFAGERLKILDRMMYTIHPAAKLEGPQFDDAGSAVEKSAYLQLIIKEILKEADAQARKYLEAGDTQAYYSFLTMALTVPLHEGLYIHFRKSLVNVCQSDANSGAMVKRASESSYKIFSTYFKNPQFSFFPECSELNDSSGIRQMIRSGDGTDLSIMQVSIRWHFDDFLANKKYESVSRTLGYGYGLLLSGFDAVYRNIDQYPCLTDQEGGRKKINYLNVIRGIWAGKYNSGSIAQTCRFADSSSPYKNHDIQFAKNLQKILSFNGVLPVDYVGEIKLQGEAADAIREIVKNLKEQRNDQTALMKILGR